MARGMIGKCLAAVVVCTAAGSAMGVVEERIDLNQPYLDKNGQVVFPEGFALPRYATPAEVEFMRNERPVDVERGLVGPPRQPLRTTSEYEAVDEIVLDHAGSAAASWRQIQYHMARWITNEGNANVNFAVTSVAAGNALINTLTAYVAPGGGTINMSRVRTHVRATNAIWMRDYGPRFAYEGDVRIVNDHTYNLTSRTLDNAHPAGYSAIYKFPLYDTALRHGGGNYHLNSLNAGFASQLIVNENAGLGSAGVINRLQQWWNTSTQIFAPLPTTIDGTQHLDMWVQVTGDNTVVVGNFINNATGSNIVNAGATWFQNNGWNVFRTPNYSISGIHYTFTNTVMCNNIIMVPTFTNTLGPAAAGPGALATFQAALPGHTVVGIPCQDIIGAAGAIHCIVMHRPPNKNGVNPGAIVYSPNGATTYLPNESVSITWATDDDTKPQVLTIDIQLSLDGGTTFPITVASGTADDGQFTWTVPDVYSTQARIRVVARDAQNNIGSDISDADFTIDGTPPPLCTGDTNGDNVIDAADLSVILGNFGQPASGPAFGDVNNDGVCNGADLSVILGAFGTSC